jgi:hypothetical protein
MKISAEDFIDVFFPEPSCFRMTLHGSLNRNDMVVRNWITTFGDPPRLKGLAGKNIKTLFRGRGFTEGIRDIEPKTSLFSTAERA